MLRKISHKGALFVEYALLLAFVTLAGGAFLNSDSSIAASVKNIFSNAGAVLAEAAGLTPANKAEEETKPDTGTQPTEENKTNPTENQPATNNKVTLENAKFGKGVVLVIEESNGGESQSGQAVTQTEPTLSLEIGKVTGEKNVAGLESLLSLEGSSTYKTSLDLSGVKAQDLAIMDGAAINIKTFYKDAAGNYHYSLADSSNPDSYDKTFAFKNGSFEGLDSYTFTTNSNQEQYTYITVVHPDGETNENINRITKAVKDNLIFTKQ